MTWHYLDIETTGVEPSVDSFQTIQYADLSSEGHPLVILWRDDFKSNREFLQKFQDDTKFFTNKWGFKPTGFNLPFEHKWLQHHGVGAGLVPFNRSPQWFENRPTLDLRPLAIMFNEGEIEGATLEAFSGKSKSGNSALNYIGDRVALEEYIQDEFEAFRDFFFAMKYNLPGFFKSKILPGLNSQTKLRQNTQR